MNENPFESPAVESVEPDADSVSLNGMRQPFGISVLALANLFTGLRYIGTVTNGVWGLPFQITAADRILMPVPLLLAIYAMLGVVAFSSPLGMLRGKRWGWWFAALYYAYGFANNASALAWVLNTKQSVTLGIHHPGYYLFENGVGLIVSGLVLMYLLRDNVVHSFDFDRGTQSAPIGILAAVSMLVFITFTLLRSRLMT